MSTEQSTARIPLRARDGSIRAYAIVDAADYEWASQFRWNCDKGYARRHKQVPGTGKFGKKKSYYLHRELLGAGPGQLVDHIDRNPLNCRRGNLRFANRTINSRNSKLNYNSKTGYRGVSFDSQYGKYRAQIVVNNVRKSCGRHATPEQAAKAYDEAARRYHGEHAMLNFPDQRAIS